jgi:uncharacterized protein YggE
MVRMPKTLVAAALVALTTAASAQTTTPIQPGESLLEVQAQGEGVSPPDVGTMDIGMVTTGTTAREATDANATAMTAVIAAIRKTGGEAQAIRTQQISVQPRFARNGNADYEGQANIAGYVARNSVTVTLARLVLAPDVVAAAFSAGANSVSGPQLRVRDNKAVLRVARLDALAKARAEADVYADGLGMKISRVLRVSERGNNSVMGQLQFMAGASARVAPPVSPGEIVETVYLWIDYAMVPK